VAKTTLRVHNLAKELGVESKAIIDKCRAEGVELKNHMATVSVGLAEPS
jgi:translation initiation factor IF-2